MGLLRKISETEIQGEAVTLVRPAGATIICNIQCASSIRIEKKRKLDKPHLTTSSITTPLNEISDDSDVSSDEEKLPRKSPPGRLSERSTKIRRKNHVVRRRVAFGDIASTTEYFAATITKAELRDLKRDLWYTKQDRLQSQAECLEVLKAFRIQNAEEVMRFSAVYRASMQVPFSQESSDYLERATVSIPLTIRGMEWGIAPKLKKRRKEHIKSILALQKQIRDIELRERFASSRSLQSSRPARIMARMIGEGDASASQLGTTSTALHVTTVPMAKKKTAAEKTLFGTKLPVREHHQNNKETINVARRSSVTKSCGVAITKKTKMGHARRRRRAVLWRK